MKKIVLCVTDKQLIAGIWQWGKLQSRLTFGDHEAGHADFAQFIQSHPKHSLYMLVDALEEDYRVELLPHVTGSAKDALVARKLGQIHRNSLYRTALWLNREITGRKDDRYLMVALTNHDAPQRWLSIIQAQQGLLAGVYLLSMVGQTIIKRLKLTTGNILYSECTTAGLRQTFYQEGNLRISRIAPISAEDRTRLTYFQTVETEKTKLYLISQRCITRDAKISMVMPQYLDDTNQTLCKAITQENSIPCETIDLSKFSMGLNLSPTQLAQQPELLHMHLVANGAVPPNLAPSELSKHFNVNNIKRGIFSAALATLIIGLAVSAYFLLQHFNAQEKIEQAKQETTLQERMYQEAALNFPKTPVSSSDLQASVETYQRIQQESKQPVRMMQVISQAIASQPEIEVKRMHWLLSNEAEPKDIEEVSDDVTKIAGSTQQTDTAFSPDTTHLHEFAFVNGEIARFNGDYRAALKSVNVLVDKLRADPQVAHVKIIQVPVNVSSYTSLQGSTADEQSNNQAQATFKLRVVLKPEEVKS